MRYMEYKLLEGCYINRFLTAGVFKRNVSFHKTVLHGKVNEWMKSGYAVYDNPCRKEFFEKRKKEKPPFFDFTGLCAGDEVEVFGQKKELKVYFPFESAGVADSGFYEKPTYLRSYGYTLLNVPKDERTEFEIFTCGAMTVWLNGQFVTDFVPFQRNEEQHTRIAVKLKEGTNSLVICLEDLAERDTDFHYKICYLGEQNISILLPVGEKTDTMAVGKAENALSNMYFEKEAYLSEPVYLKMEPFSEAAVEATVTSDRFSGAKKYTFLPDQKEIYLFHADEVPSGFHFLTVSFVLFGIAMSRRIGVYSLNTRFMSCQENTYEDRKKRIRDIICNLDENSDYKAIIEMHEGKSVSNLDQILSSHLEWVSEKRDCSDFRMIILVYMYTAFRERFPQRLRREIEDAMVGYRYWMDEPGEDVMWFFSENHALIFHICQYFAGKALPKQIFTCSGMTGEKAALKAEHLLNQWFENFFKEFVTEWNSSTYLPIDIMGLAYLYDLTPKQNHLHKKAKRALDMLAFSLAVNEHKGTIMTSFGRTYEREMKGSYSTGMSSLLYLFYNAGYMNEHVRALVPIVVGDYEPPDEFKKYVNMTDNQEIIYENTQGVDGYVNLYLYKNAQVLLSTAVGFRPYRRGYQENIVQAAIDATAQVFINHPGEKEIYGNGRPGFWAGNGCLPMASQYKKISIIRFQIGMEHWIDFTHAYIPLMEFDNYKIGKEAVALEKNGGYIGVRALNGLRVQRKGACRNREFISPGRDNVWVLKVGTDGEYQNTGELLKDMEQMKITVESSKRVCIILKNEQYVLDNAALYVNGVKIHDYPHSVQGIVQIIGGNENEY